jgi:hypothetical protein
MKRIAFACVVLLVTAASLVAAPAGDITGKWHLDPAGSKDLPESILQLKEWRLDVARTGHRLIVSVVVQPRDPAAPVLRDTLEYPVDGSEQRVQSVIDGPEGLERVPTSLASRTLPNGSVELRATREIGQMRETTTENWLVNADGSMTVRLHRVSPEYTDDFVLRFVRD